VGVIDGASEGGDCDEVICAGSVNQEESEQKEVVEMKKGVDNLLLHRMLMYNESHAILPARAKCAFTHRSF